MSGFTTLYFVPFWPNEESQSILRNIIWDVTINRYIFSDVYMYESKTKKLLCCIDEIEVMRVVFWTSSHNVGLFIIPLLRHFTILGQKNAQNMPRYYTVEQGKNTD